MSESLERRSIKLAILLGLSVLGFASAIIGDP